MLEESSSFSIEIIRGQSVDVVCFHFEGNSVSELKGERSSRNG